MNPKIKKREKKMEIEEEEIERLHSEALVIDGLSTYIGVCLPGEGKQYHVDQLAREGLDISNITVIKLDERVGDLLDKLELKGTADPWDWWERSGVDVIHTTLGISQGTGEQQAYRKVIKDLARHTLRFDKCDKLVKITKADDIVRAKREGKYGVILGVQNLNILTGDLKNMDLFYYFGIRTLQLTYNLRNLFGNGCTERKDEGLSELGIQAIRKMNDLGILLDLSHCGIQTTLEAIETSRIPVAFTHTFCRAIRDHDRGKTDEQLRVLRKNNGYMGILLVPSFLGDGTKEVSLNDFLDHVDHAVEILGVERVGIGTDYGAGCTSKEVMESVRKIRKKEIEEWGIDSIGWRPGHHLDDHDLRLSSHIKGYRDWRDFPNITKALKSRGYSSEQIIGILGQNFFRVFRDAVG